MVCCGAVGFRPRGRPPLIEYAPRDATAAFFSFMGVIGPGRLLLVRGLLDPFSAHACG
jgi:hypothetical protein